MSANGQMFVYVTTEFTGHYPVGTAAVVIAPNTVIAAWLLNEELIKEGLKPTAKPENMEYLITALEYSMPRARILVNGNY